MTSTASSGSSGGRIVGRRRASIVLPQPGGPVRSRWCAPAAAISSASRAVARPRTSARSTGSSSTGSAGSVRSTVPVGRDRARAPRPSGTRAASRGSARCGRAGRGRAPPRRWFAGGTSTVSTPVRASASASTRVPGTARTVPSRPSSPSTPTPSRQPAGSSSSPSISARAIASSRPAPVLRTVAGERLTVIRLFGHGMSDDCIAARTRSARLAPRGVGQADDGVAGQPVGDVHLDGDAQPLDAEQGGAVHGGDHDDDLPDDDDVQEGRRVVRPRPLDAAERTVPAGCDTDGGRARRRIERRRDEEPLASSRCPGTSTAS